MENENNKIPFTPRFQKAIGRAKEIAFQKGYKYIGIEHLIVACFEFKDGPGVDLIRESGFDVAMLKKAVERAFELRKPEGAEVSLNTAEIATLLRKLADQINP